MVKMTKPLRTKIETLIYTFFDKLDPTKTNTNHYQEKFANMSDEQFVKFLKGRFPYRYYQDPFNNDPTVEDAKAALDLLGVPLLEKVNLPYLHINKDGVPVNTKECLVCYLNIKKMKQFVTKKNSMSTNIEQRDMKTGLLTGHDKNGKTSDREFESLAILGLDNTLKELSTYRADSMDAKSVFYNQISLTGRVSQADVPVDIEDSLSRNTVSVYMLGALIGNNIISEEDYELPYTKHRRTQITRV